jgi:type II secretory pathway component PulK
MAQKNAYSSMKAHDLARITRERGLEKPKVITLREWADFLAADDAKRLKASQSAESVVEADTSDDGDRDTEDADDSTTTRSTPPRAASKKKGD